MDVASEALSASTAQQSIDDNVCATLVHFGLHKLLPGWDGKLDAWVQFPPYSGHVG